MILSFSEAMLCLKGDWQHHWFLPIRCQYHPCPSSPTPTPELWLLKMSPYIASVPWKAKTSLVKNHLCRMYTMYTNKSVHRSLWDNKSPKQLCIWMTNSHRNNSQRQWLLVSAFSPRLTCSLVLSGIEVETLVSREQPSETEVFAISVKHFPRPSKWHIGQFF